MAVSHNQRLKRKAAKAQKRKGVVADKRRDAKDLRAFKDEAGLALPPPPHETRDMPVERCLLTQDFEATGSGTLVIARALPEGGLVAGIFLLDLWCHGIRDARLEYPTVEELDEDVADEARFRPFAPFDPGRACRLMISASERCGRLEGELLDFSLEIGSLFSGVAAAGDEWTFSRGGRIVYRPLSKESDQDKEFTRNNLVDVFGENSFDEELGADPVEAGSHFWA